MDNILIKIKFVLSLAIPICYLIMGVYVMMEKIFIVKIEPIWAYSLGAVLIIYGIFRLYRAFGIIKNKVD